MPNGGHISCVYCANDQQGRCDVFGVETSPCVLCRMFRGSLNQSRDDARKQWPMLEDLKSGIVYEIDNDTFSVGHPRPIYELKRMYTSVKIQKGLNHSKITGDFAEALVLYWLSKYGFECVRVDHTGIDLIARNPHTQELMGISVKSRCRDVGKENTYLRIAKDDPEKIEAACEAFNCKPYFAIVVDVANLIRGYVLSREHLLKLCPPTKTEICWKMGTTDVERYEKDPEIKIFELETKTRRWWGTRI